ncbi:MAG: glycosyltransferase [Geobacteraceae bacterium]|nr:glycosyltransferase [Geobacteraceae bacterium]
MIRILHTIDTTGPGGAESVFVNLVKGLDADRFYPVVVIGGPGWVCAELRKNGIEPIFINSKGAFNFSYLRGLVKTIRENKIDIIQSHLLGANLYSCLAGLLCNVPVVSTFHGFVDINSMERFYALKSKIISFGSEKIIFVSKKLLEYYVKQKRMPASKSITIYNGIDIRVFKPCRDDSIRKKLELESNQILVGAIGNIRSAKGYEYLLAAARLVIDRRPQIRFVIAGEGSGEIYHSLLEVRKNLNLEKQVNFLGFVSDTSKLLNNLDLFVLSSISEGFSISTIEAMACGIPVVVTQCGGPEEIIENGLSGIVVPPRDPSLLANAIIRSVENNSRSANEACAKRCKDAFSISKMINDYIELYNSILEKG